MYRWIEDEKEFQDIARTWDQAVVETGSDNPFWLSDFILTWWKYYSTSLRLRIFVVYENGNVVGGVPLCQNRRGWLEYPGGWAANYTEVLDSGTGKTVWQAFCEALTQASDWRGIRLARYRRHRLDMDAATSVLSANGIDRGGLLWSVFPCGWTYIVDIREDAYTLLEYLPKKLRYYIRRSLKEVAKIGEIRLCSLQKREEIDDWFSQYVRLSRASFRRRGQSSAFEDPRYCSFFLELLHKFYDVGYLDAHMLKLNERIIAIHFGYSLENNLNYILTTFDSEFARFSPGHLLIYKLLELAYKRGSRQFDFYTGYHLYKSQWSNRREEILGLEIWQRCLRNRIERAVRMKMRKSLTRTKFVESVRSWRMTRRVMRAIRG